MRKLVLLLVLSAGAAAQESPEKPLRVGMIGLDTSHVIAFTQILHDAKNGFGVRVVCGFKGGSPDVEASHTRVDKFTKDLQDRFGVEIVGSIDELVRKVDAVMVMSVDGRPHLEQARPAFAAKKRVYIDKPMAGTYAQGKEIVRLSKESGAPFFSASSYRFNEALLNTKNDPALGRILGCETSSHASLEPNHPDLFWYGVHGVEALFTVMGAGCESVQRVHTKDVDVVVGKWKDGRVASFRGVRKGASSPGVTIFGEKAVKSSIGAPGQGGYKPLVAEIVKFLKGGPPPVSPEEMLEVLAFMQAADLSKQRNGAEVKLSELD